MQLGAPDSPGQVPEEPHEHAPLLHVSPPPHTTPQMPQFSACELKSTQSIEPTTIQHILSAVPEQFKVSWQKHLSVLGEHLASEYARPPLQSSCVEHWHSYTTSAQLGPPVAIVHAVSQSPQCSVSCGVQVWVQHMSSPSQSPASAHPQRQAPASSMQIFPPTALPEQAFPQSAQFWTVPSMVSQPADPALQSA